MHGVPDDLNLSPFVGCTLDQIALGAHQIQSRFSGPGGYTSPSLAVQGHRELRGAILIVAISCLTGCARPSLTIPQADPTGMWTVVGHTAPGIGAMSDSEAAGWNGREARFSASLARFHRDSCTHPTYRSRTLSADSLFDIGFRIGPRDLGFQAGQSVVVTDVTCHGTDWAAPGSLLIWIRRDRVYTTWDGMFFTLARRD